MQPEGLEYVLATYGLVLATLVLWIWILGRRVNRMVERDLRRERAAAAREATGPMVS